MPQPVEPIGPVRAATARSGAASAAARQRAAPLRSPGAAMISASPADAAPRDAATRARRASSPAPRASAVVLLVGLLVALSAALAAAPRWVWGLRLGALPTEGDRAAERPERSPPLRFLLARLEARTVPTASADGSRPRAGAPVRCRGLQPRSKASPPPIPVASDAWSLGPDADAAGPGAPAPAVAAAPPRSGAP